jgi:hypothetical protein
MIYLFQGKHSNHYTTDAIYMEMNCTNQWFSLGTLISSTNKTDSHDITEIFLTVVLNIKKLYIVFFLIPRWCLIKELLRYN